MGGLWSTVDWLQFFFASACRAAGAFARAVFGDVSVNNVEQWYDGFFVERIVAMLPADFNMHKLTSK